MTLTLKDIRRGGVFGFEYLYMEFEELPIPIPVTCWYGSMLMDASYYSDLGNEYVGNRLTYQVIFRDSKPLGLRPYKRYEKSAMGFFSDRDERVTYDIYAKENIENVTFPQIYQSSVEDWGDWRETDIKKKALRISY